MVDGDLSHCRAQSEERQCPCWDRLCWITELCRAGSKAEVRASSRRVVTRLVLKLVSPAFLALEGPDWRERWTW